MDKLPPGKIQISSMIPPEWVKIKEEKGTTWLHIIGLGIKSLQNNPQMIARLNSSEGEVLILKNKIERLTGLLDSYVLQVESLKETIEKTKGGSFETNP